VRRSPMKAMCNNVARVFGLVIVLLLLPCIGFADDRPYMVEGRAIYRCFKPALQISYDFALCVSNKSWGMEFEGGSRSKLRFKQICDGSNLVTMIYWNYGRVQGPPGDRDGVVNVCRRNVPDTNPGVAHAVFVTFAAQLYLPPGTNGLLCPLWHPDREVSGAAFVRSDWDLMPGSPLANVIRCRYEAQKWKVHLHQEMGKDPTNEESGKTLIATYRSFGRTNLEDRVFPTACAYSAFAPYRMDGGDKASPVYEIVVTNVVLRAAVAAPLFDPRFQGVATVEDYRSGQRLTPTYIITNSAPLGLP
jgi:hypothetical protein